MKHDAVVIFKSSHGWVFSADKVRFVIKCGSKKHHLIDFLSSRLFQFQIMIMTFSPYVVCVYKVISDESLRRYITKEISS